MSKLRIDLYENFDSYVEFLRARRYASAVFAVVACLDVCPSVTRRYCLNE